MLIFHFSFYWLFLRYIPYLSTLAIRPKHQVWSEMIKKDAKESERTKRMLEKSMGSESKNKGEDKNAKKIKLKERAWGQLVNGSAPPIRFYSKHCLLRSGYGQLTYLIYNPVKRMHITSAHNASCANTNFMASNCSFRFLNTFSI